MESVMKKYLHSFKVSPTKYSLIKRKKKSSFTVKKHRRHNFN